MAPPRTMPRYLMMMLALAAAASVAGCAGDTDESNDGTGTPNGGDGPASGQGGDAPSSIDAPNPFGSGNDTSDDASNDTSSG